MFGATPIFHVKIWNHPIETTILICGFFVWYQLVLLRDSEVPVFFFEISPTFPHVNHPAHQGDNHPDATRDVAWPHVFSWHVEDLQIWKLGDFPRWFCPASNHHSTVWGNQFFDIWKKQLSNLAITSFLCFFSTWRYSEEACFNRALQISDVIQVYFHWWCLWHLSTSWSKTRWGVGFTWSCSVGLYSSLGSTKKYR